MENIRGFVKMGWLEKMGEFPHARFLANEEAIGEAWSGNPDAEMSGKSRGRSNRMRVRDPE